MNPSKICLGMGMVLIGIGTMLLKDPDEANWNRATSGDRKDIE